ncbi:MAG: AbrB/MazE/SpoVT family DNA-binding domain-containing protein [Dehalococcoidia bacterium]|nr:hypothetical protein [Chloroflexota bacterium]
MGTGTKARIVKIGNSQGIRIPKLLLDQTDIREAVELEVQGGQLVIRPARGPRYDWNDQFAMIADRADDGLLDADAISLTAWDADEWEW